MLLSQVLPLRLVQKIQTIFAGSTPPLRALPPERFVPSLVPLRRTL